MSSRTGRRAVSVFELFKLGLGPSSSHTMGPMTAAGRFLAWLGGRVAATARVEVTLYVSAALVLAAAWIALTMFM